MAIKSIRNYILRKLNIKFLNQLRKLKWFFLTPFLNYNNIIKKQYESEIDLKVLMKILPSIVHINSQSIAIDRPTLRERRPIRADARDPDSPRKNARSIKTDRDKHPFGVAAHPPR